MGRRRGKQLGGFSNRQTELQVIQQSREVCTHETGRQGPKQLLAHQHSPQPCALQPEAGSNPSAHHRRMDKHAGHRYDGMLFIHKKG